MKNIYLNRHAKSSWEQPYSSDFERKLNPRGKANALFMGQRFAKEVDKIAIISSSAARAQETAGYFATAMGLKKSEITLVDLIYEATVDELMRFIRSLPDELDAVILFGHNPGFTDLATYLDHRFGDYLATCARVRLDVPLDSWQLIGADSGTVIYHDYPRKYKEMEGL